MLDTIGAFGSGIGTNLLSDSLSKKLEAFKDKKAIASFTQSLRDWEIEFEKQNDGTIITNGAFYSHVKYHNVIENIVAYVLEPSMNAVTEDEFLNCLHEKMVNRIEETTEKKLSWNDSRLIRNFLTHLLTTTRAFLFQKISLEDRGLFYLVCQNNAKLEHLERIVKEKFQMQDQNVQQIVEQLSMAIQKSETEERIKAKMASWNSRQIKNLGNRYTPDLNIPVEIMDSLHGASVDQQFQNIFYDKVDKFLIAMRHTELSEINALCDAIEKYAIELNFFNITSSDIDVIISTVNAIKDFLTSKIEEYYENPEGKKNFDSKAYQLYEKLGIANEFNDYLTNTTVRVAVSPYIILAGDGGVGKSHLIADYIDNCDSLGQTSLLLLGQQFSAGMDVLAILPTLLGCDITYHELFDIFEAIACTQKSRVLICIDALNEGAGVTFWNSVLGGLVDFLKEFPHIGLLVSVRTQYEDSLFDGQDTLRAQMQRIEHFGFTTVEHDAMHQYFSFYGITIDPVVFPISEFRNPLFLRLFCTANRNTHISLGDISLPFVYSQYISVMEQKVAKRCNYNKSYKLISKIIDEMVSKRINEHSGTVSLSLDDTLALIVDICKKWNVNTDVYSALLAEGVLTQGITYNGDEYVYITYERLEDYFLAQKIVSAYAQLSEEQFFEKYSWMLNKPDLLQFFGIVLAEDWEYELSDVFSSENAKNTYRVRNAFLYGFQSYFYAWKQLHPIDLKNIAIKRIFELGYDVEKHGKYDRNCTDRVGLRFQLGRKERIGKKYQWIALYELAAQVCDNYQMTVYDNDIGEPHQEYCKGSFEPDIRNIDPTVLVTPGFDNLHIDIAAFSYDIPNNSYEEWLADFSNTPAFEQCVKLQSGAHQYLLLTGEYDWKEAKRLGFRSYDLPRKDMWHQIRGYVVKNEYAESLICALSGVDFMGRWMPEAQSNSAMYNKEYYWSDAHTFFNNPYYCGLEWVNIDSDHLNCVFPEKVLIPVKQYYSERKGELNSLNSEIASIYWHKPCEEMYTKLQLKYLKGSNSAFVDGAGELVCFESSELIGNDTGFYIRYDKLLEFLKSSSYTLVWTSLCEKRILTPSFGRWDLPPKAIHMSSVYYLKDGKIAKASETLFEDRLYY